MLTDTQLAMKNESRFLYPLSGKTLSDKTLSSKTQSGKMQSTKAQISETQSVNRQSVNCQSVNCQSDEHQALEASLLGKQTPYQDQYNPSILFALPRDTHWEKLGINRAHLPFKGEDLWNAYELSWVNPHGKPKVAMAEFRFPAKSTHIIESKSLKLYLNSFNQSCFTTQDEVVTRLTQDLSDRVGAPVGVRIVPYSCVEPIQPPTDYQSIDDVDIICEYYEPTPALLKLNQTDGTDDVIYEKLRSDLLKTNCPVTGQPDWATLFVEYRGPKLDHSALLSYIVSYRQHSDFHEHCVEKIYMDLWELLGHPNYLSVYARYTRRGGLDINPFRASSIEAPVPNWRTIQQ